MSKLEIAHVKKTRKKPTKMVDCSISFEMVIFDGRCLVIRSKSRSDTSKNERRYVFDRSILKRDPISGFHCVVGSDDEF